MVRARSTEMIRNFRVLRLAKNKSEFQRLSDFFAALDLAPGEHWDSARNRGQVYLCPDGGIELGMGQGFPAADLVFEVADADTTYELLRKRNAGRLSTPEDTPFGVRMFAAEVAGLRAVFYHYLPEKQHRQAKESESPLDARGRRFALVVSRFNSFITERLLDGALLALRQTGVRREDLHVTRVPGAFEIPGAARALAETGKYDAIVCLGCLLRGGTLHYEVIANEVTRGIGQSAQETGVPHGFGVLTCDTLEQAIDRAGLKAGNKGYEAAMAAIEMAGLKKAVSRQPSGKASLRTRTRSRSRDTHSPARGADRKTGRR